MSRIGRKRSLWGLAVGALAAIALLYATAIPSSAAPGGKKYYSFTVTPPGVLAGAQGVPFQVTITNTSPSGSSSNISSVSITVPSQFTIVGTPTFDASSSHTNSNATIGCNNPSAQQINICSLDPIKRLENVTVDFTANVISPAPASGVSDPWLVEANTGTQLNGQNFDPNPSQGTVTTTIYGDGIDCQGSSGPVTGGDPITTSTLDRTDNGPSTGCVEVPYTLTSDTSTVTLLKDQATVVQQGAQFSLTITWGLPAGQYPNYGTTTFDLDGDPNTTTDAFTPVNCTIVNGVAQYPVNPDGNGNYWPAGTAEQPWCLASSTIGPMPGGTDMQVTETFLGSGDPVISRSK